MRCPVCHKMMAEEAFGDVNVDVCKDGCKGIWFDWFELSKVDEQSEGFGEALQEALDSPRASNQRRGKIKCPKCNTPMHVHRHQTAKEVTVDECVSCGGFFLDAGELAVIRDGFMNQEEQEAYQERLIADIPEYSSAVKGLEEKQAKQRTRQKAIHRFMWVLLGPRGLRRYKEHMRRWSK